jgi:GNAT superfamily N-acetyltransferase
VKVCASYYFFSLRRFKTPRPLNSRLFYPAKLPEKRKNLNHAILILFHPFCDGLWHGSHPKIMKMEPKKQSVPEQSGIPPLIRPATPADVPLILRFIRALAEYEREPDAVTATEEQLLADGFGPHPYYHCLIAEHNGEPAGFAFYFFNYSTWLGRPGLYLEDLFVWPEMRGLGIGKALLARVAAIAVEKGCQRLQWEVLDWNTPAIEFYKAMGAEFLDEWRNVRVSGTALARLAGSDCSTGAGNPQPASGNARSDAAGSRNKPDRPDKRDGAEPDGVARAERSGREKSGDEKTGAETSGMKTSGTEKTGLEKSGAERSGAGQ